MQSVNAQDIINDLIQNQRVIYNLSDSKIKGKFDLSHQNIKTAIYIKDCIFLDEVDLRYCEFNQVVSFEGCHFKKEFNSGDKIKSYAIYNKDFICNGSHFYSLANFNGIICQGCGYFHKSKFQEEVDFGHAYFRVHLEANNSCFQKKANFNSLQTHDVHLNDAKFYGEVNFVKAEIQESLELDNSYFEGEIDFNSLKCGDIFFRNSSIESNNKKISFKYLTCDYFHFGKKDNIPQKYQAKIQGKIVNFTYCQCKTLKLNHVLFEGTEETDFSYCCFESLDFSDSKISGNVNIQFTNINSQLILKNAHFYRDVSFYDSSIKQIILGDTFPFRKEKALDLRGISFDIFEQSEEKQWQQLVEAQNPEKFRRDPYLQLEKYYQKIGDETRATEIYYEGCRALRKHALSKDNRTLAEVILNSILLFFFYPYLLLERLIKYLCKNSNQNISCYWGKKKRAAIDWVLEILTGYGVKTERLLIPIAFFVLLGIFILGNDLVSTKKICNSLESSSVISVRDLETELSLNKDSSEKIFTKFAYSLDLFLPVLDLGFDDNWQLAESTHLGKKIYKILHILAGWFFVPLFITSISGALRRN